VRPEVNWDPLVISTEQGIGVDWPELADDELSGDEVSTVRLLSSSRI
jgi:hypothetical protein